MKSFRQYLREQLNTPHPHYRGSEPSDVDNVTKHTYEDEELGVRSYLMTHPNLPGQAYFGFEVKNMKTGEYTDKPPKKGKGEEPPQGRLQSALGHAAHFAENNDIHTITFQTADQKENASEEDKIQGKTNTGLFLGTDTHISKWKKYEPEVSKNTKMVQVAENPFSQFRHLYEEDTDWGEWKLQSDEGLLPKLTEEEFKNKYRSAPIKTLPHLIGVANTEAETVVGNPKEAKKYWRGHKPDYEDSYYENLVKNIHSAPPPVVVITETGEHHLLSGNSRAMIMRAHYPESPVKVRIIDLRTSSQA